MIKHVQKSANFSDKLLMSGRVWRLRSSEIPPSSEEVGQVKLAFCTNRPGDVEARTRLGGSADDPPSCARRIMAEPLRVPPYVPTAVDL